MVKNPPTNAGDKGSIPGLRRSPRDENGNPLQYSCLEKFHGQRSLAGYKPWGHKKSDMTEHPCTTNLSYPGASLDSTLYGHYSVQ